MPRLVGQAALKQVTLVLTEQCNQRCSYCYVPVHQARRMSPETARGAVELLFAHAPRVGSLSVSFFGGEPFLAQDLMRATHDAVRAQQRLGQRVSLSSPTNVTALDDAGLSLARSMRLELAVSLDGEGSERCMADGRSSEELVRERLPQLRSLPELKLIARMTVTPRNVGHLASNVRAIAELGFRRIVFQPAYEDAWDAPALKTWGEQVHALANWLGERIAAGLSIPELPAWLGILARLEGAPRKHCGAGVERVAVGVDGGIHACYRMAYDPRGAELLLGRVGEGLTQDAALEAFARLDPSRPSAEGGDCASCDAAAGCTFFCPAIGLRLAGDITKIPAVVCQLVRAEFAACRALAGVVRQVRARPRRIAAVASAALAIGATNLATSCYLASGGLCALTDASASHHDAGRPDAAPPGEDAAEPGLDSSWVGGLCPYMPPDGSEAPSDAAALAEDAQEQDPDTGFIGGLCPIVPPDDGGGTGGLC